MLIPVVPTELILKKRDMYFIYSHHRVQNPLLKPVVPTELLNPSYIMFKTIIPFSLLFKQVSILLKWILHQVRNDNYTHNNIKFVSRKTTLFVFNFALYIRNRDDSGKSGNKYLSDLAGKGYSC